MQAKTFRHVALVAWVMQGLIVFSGAAVRLTEAGLGCEDWPTCNNDQFLPERQIHGLIEFGNRVISGFVAISAIAVLIAAYRLVSRRADLLRYAWMVVGGTLVQVVLGGITVLLDLHPVVVGVHFLLSMGLLAASEMLWIASGTEQQEHTSGVSRSNTSIVGSQQSGSRRSGLDRWLIRWQLVLATIVLFTGTIVTGTGPNSGDSRADRLDFELESVARIHAVTVWLLLALLVLIALRLAGRLGGRASLSSRPSQRPRHRNRFDVVRWMLGVAMLQGAIGYTQFALGVPPLLVELHIMGAVAVWSLAILLATSSVGATVVSSEAVGRSERLADLA